MKKVQLKRLSAYLAATRFSLLRRIATPVAMSLSIAVIGFWASAASLSGEPQPLPLIEKGNIQVELQTVASGLTAPIDLEDAGDGSGRLFIVEQTGTVRILKDGALL